MVENLLAAEAAGQKLEELRQKRDAAAARRVRVMGKVDRLLAASTPLQPAEMEVRDRLLRMLAALRAPGHFHSKLAELEALRRIHVMPVCVCDVCVCVCVPSFVRFELCALCV